MLKIWKFAFILFCLGSTGVVLAQVPNPTVEIVLSQPTARMGETIGAEIYVRNAVNITGIDIGITVDSACLQITDRQPGEFLPVEAENGGLTAFTELHDHDTRLAAALLDSSLAGNGDGVFFRVMLEVICAGGTAPLTVSFVELAGIEDLAAENARFITYRLTEGTVNAINTQLIVEPSEGAAVVTSEVNVTTVPVTAAPATTIPEATPGAVEVVSDAQTQSPLAIVFIIFVLVGIALPIVYVFMRNRRSEDD